MTSQDVTTRHFDYQQCKMKNHWRFVDALIKHILTVIVLSIIVCYISYSHYWLLIWRFNVWSFAFRRFVASRFLIHHFTCYLRDGWHSPITSLHFWPAIYGMQIFLIVLDQYSPTSTHFLIQPLLLDFHYLAQAIFKISTMSARSE